MKDFKRYTIILLFFSLACSKSEVSLQDYYEWQEDESNGVHKTKTVGEIAFDMKLLSPDYLTYLELKGEKGAVTPQLKDSIMKFYENNLTFVLTIGPAEESHFDITSVGIKNYEEYAERMKQLNFGLTELLELRAGGKKWKPVIVEMENIYGLEFHRKFNIVFSPEEKADELVKLDKFTVMFDDEIFGTGTSSFGFLKSSLDKTPAIKF